MKLPVFFNPRDLPGGDNSSDSFIGGVHFNKTTLDFWNYTLYSNNTLSNGSWCVLSFEPYTPALVQPNGSFVNVTWCYSPVLGIGPRGATGVGFAAAFGLALVLTLINLTKHGKRHLPAEKRFRPIGRRWQWYWAAFICATAFVSLLTNIDVDRYYLPELPIILSVFFWFIMQQGTLALVWEAVRHWGSWKERQLVDPNPFALSQDDKRSKFEFWIPLFFYFWLWLNFFLIIPRNWTLISHQRYPEQVLAEAIPSATDGRFKAAAFSLFVCWLTIATSLRHSIKHYCPRNRGLLNRFVGFLRYTPPRFYLLLPLALAVVAYQALCSFSFPDSPLKDDAVNLPAMYVGGYTPALLIVLVNAVWGFASPNEDREILRQRRIRGDAVDRELGIVHKPAWWRRVNGHVPSAGQPESMRDRIARNVRELGGNNRRSTPPPPGGSGDEPPDSVEMSSIPRHGSAAAAAAAVHSSPTSGRYTGRSDQRRSERTVEFASSMLFPNSTPRPDRLAEITADGPPPPPYGEAGRGRPSSGSGDGRPGTGERSHSTGTLNSLNAPPQQVFSRLMVGF